MSETNLIKVSKVEDDFDFFHSNDLANKNNMQIFNNNKKGFFERK